MRDITCFSSRVTSLFENNYDNMLAFEDLAMNASRNVYDKYNKEETNKILRNQFNAICGIDFKTATSMQKRQALRAHGAECFALIETVIADKMNSGWNEANAMFMQFVEDINIANGDKNEFYVEDNSLLVVSKFAGNHLDIVRQKVQPGKAFSIDTAWHAIKVYADFVLFQLGKIDFADMVDRMYKSIEQYRYAELFEAMMGMDTNLPTDMKLSTAIQESTKDAIVEQIEAVKATTGKDVILVGTRTAIQKLQGTVSYNMFSDGMKDERNQKGILANWEGYVCLPLDRVNKPGTRTSVFSAADNKKIFILPVDADFKPIKRVNEGDVIYTEKGMDGTGNMDRTMEAQIEYQEGIGVVINELFGEIIATN